MRTTIIAVLLMCAAATLVAESRPSPLVGAIRWDAWTGGAVTEQVKKTLGPKKYHDRLPWFAEVIDDKTVEIDGGRQSVMGREIDFASEAGLDYWAFLVYPESSSMSTALKQYLKSSNRDRINFCLILHSTFKAGAKWPKELARAVALLKEPGYQRVLDGRPLVYVFGGKDFSYHCFSEFIASAKEAGLNPYCVFMGWNPASDFKKVKKKGFDAVSAYAKGSNEPRFSDLAKAVEQDYWDNAANSKIPYIPLVTTGWDKRPRKDNPVSWEKGQKYHKQNVFPSKAAPTEIASHLDRAISFVKSHPDICVANAIVIYAWNEHDEGGWLTPTKGPNEKPDTSRLDAIRRILSKRDGMN